MIQQVHSTLKEIDVPLTKELFQTKFPFFNIGHMIWSFTQACNLYTKPTLVCNLSVISPVQILFDYVDVCGFALVASQLCHIVVSLSFFFWCEISPLEVDIN